MHTQVPSHLCIALVTVSLPWWPFSLRAINPRINVFEEKQVVVFR